ncbi:MAG: lytic murein transglycosylase B [Gammaproteobacteria bacterium]|nr:lytic murein transglycosylase B [Gammaproteobacteria bacterium]MDH4312009.1 lytic murein transglycosylase B [Gammaproteobacteria bacterium]MDH5273285.1 lytic murein transglycosylase B [Gammaproteobacteria bacterium]
MTRKRLAGRVTRPLRRIARPSAVALALALCQPLPAQAQAFDPTRADIGAFIASVGKKHGFEAEPLVTLFAQVESKPAILQAIAKPAERTLAWDEYRPKFLVERRIARGAEVHGLKQSELEQSQAASGVPVDILLGIVGVETFYGENVGKYRVIDALATLAFDYPPRQAFFRSELEQYLLMAREEGLDPLAPVGSYAGAMGLPQFMPSSFRNFAVDGDADGKRDLWNDWADVFSSVGNYLKVHGWRAGEPVMAAAEAGSANLAGLDDKLALTETVGSLRARGVKFETSLPANAPAMLVALKVAAGTEYRVGFTNFYAITRYNRSHMYASAVSDLADAIAATRAGLPLPAAAGFIVPAAPPPVRPANGWSTTSGGK